MIGIRIYSGYSTRITPCVSCRTRFISVCLTWDLLCSLRVRQGAVVCDSALTMRCAHCCCLRREKRSGVTAPRLAVMSEGTANPLGAPGRPINTRGESREAHRYYNSGRGVASMAEIQVPTARAPAVCVGWLTYSVGHQTLHAARAS
jgi:hypothetical protein